MISFFGIVHQCGGSGTELLGALDILQGLGVPVRCIVPPGDPILHSERAEWLRGRGVPVIDYRPGLFEKCEVLCSFGEAACLDLIYQYSDRPKYFMWSGCMGWACDNDVQAAKDGLIDEYIFQTPRAVQTVGQEIKERSGAEVVYRKGYVPYMDPASPLLNIQPSQRPDEFRVLRVSRDDPDKWDPETWRTFVGVCSPPSRPVAIDVVGWGSQAQEKVGNPCDPTSRWAGLLNVSLHPHTFDQEAMGNFYNRAHVLLHHWPTTESFGYATVQAMLSGAVPVVSKAGGFLDLVRHGETGFLVDSGDEAAYFASKLAFEPTTLAVMAQMAQRWVLTEGPGSFSVCSPWWEEIVRIRNAGGPL